MFKTTSSGGSTARCSLSTLLILAFIGMMFSSLALAQPLPKHGIAVAKACIDEVRTCQTDLDCSDNLCLPSTCNLSIPDTTYCEITVTYNDDFEDFVTIDEAWDVMDAITLGNPGGDEVRIPAAGNLPIAFISGNTTCIVGGSLPCDIGPQAGLTPPGSVTFASNEYMPQPGDVSPLPDKAFTLATDKCDGIPDGNCSVAQKEASAVAQLDLVDGCEPQDPVICPPDDDSCTEDFECDPATGLCPDPGPRTVCPPDDDACTEDFECDPATGLCPDPGPRTVCPPDDDSCTEDFECDPATGLCPDPGPRTVCPPDDDSCTEDFECDPATGLCPDPGPRTVCPPDDDACTEDFECDPATGLCPDPGPRTVCPPDDDACTEDFECDPATGLCPDPGPRTVCPPDDDACTEDFECDPATGLCPDPGPRTVCPPDDDACTEDFECDPATGLCPDPGPREVCVDDVCQICDPTSGLCVDRDPYPGECSDLEICRTPGFWATHGGVEKNRSTNITQAVIDSVGYLEVCGDQITNTDAGSLWGLNDASAIEAMCTSPKGTLERQLVRQLTAAALNCVMSGGSDGACTGTGRAELLSDCNTACTGGLSIRSVNECIDEIDCFNNGGTWDGVSCLTGVGYCEGTDDPGPIVVCWDGNECAREAACIPSMETCHDRELCLEDSDLCFTPPGPAGSSGECKLAKKNEIFYPY